jgi:hypothetical protein
LSGGFAILLQRKGRLGAYRKETVFNSTFLVCLCCSPTQVHSVQASAHLHGWTLSQLSAAHSGTFALIFQCVRGACTQRRRVAAYTETCAERDVSYYLVLPCRMQFHCQEFDARHDRKTQCRRLFSDTIGKCRSKIRFQVSDPETLTLMKHLEATPTPF